MREDLAVPFPGRLLPLVVPLIDGRRSTQAIARRLDGRAALLDVLFALDLLKEAGVLEEAPRVGEPEAIRRVRSNLGLDARSALARLEQGPVAVEALGFTGSATRAVRVLTRALRDEGLRVSRRGAIRVVLIPDYLGAPLEPVHREAGASSAAWLPVRATGARWWIGPLFDPPATPCWRCLEMRLQEWRRTRFDVDPPAAADPARIAEGALRLAALEVLRLVLDPDRARRDSAVLTVDPGTLEARRHRVERQPHCPGCATHAHPVDSPAGQPRLQPRRKAGGADGGFRALPAEEVWDKFARHISPITGVVRDIQPYGPEPPGAAPAYRADHLFGSRCARRGVPAMRTSAGKGVTRTQARVSALCESLERYSGVFRGDERRQLASSADLGGAAIAPARLLHFSPRQYRQRDRWNRAERPETFVPRPFEPASAIEWSPAWSLTRQRILYVPTALAFYGYPLPEEHSFGRADSNGCAAGSSLEDAVLQGLLELVERDAVALWWYNRVPRPRIEPDEIRNPVFKSLLHHYRSLGRTIRLFDITSDLDIPVCAAVSWHDRAPELLILGFGAHFDRDVAAARALTEMNQFLAGAEAGQPRCRFGRNPLERSFLDGTCAPAPHRGTPASTTDLLEDIARIAGVLERRGLELLYLDQTRADIGLPVVRVIVPGLRHFWPRFGQGRLFDVPLELDWVGRANREAELNRTFFFT